MTAWGSCEAPQDKRVRNWAYKDIYIYVCIYVNTFVHVYLCMYIYIYINTYIYIHVSLRLYVCMQRICTHINIYIYIYAYMDLYTHMHLPRSVSLLYVYICMQICIYTYTILIFGLPNRDKPGDTALPEKPPTFPAVRAVRRIAKEMRECTKEQNPKPDIVQTQALGFQCCFFLGRGVEVGARTWRTSKRALNSLGSGTLLFSPALHFSLAS